MQCYITSLLALELTQAYCSFVPFPPTPLIVFLVAMKKCAMPLSEPVVDHRPRSEMVRRSWRIRGGGARGFRHISILEEMNKRTKKTNSRATKRTPLWALVLRQTVLSWEVDKNLNSTRFAKVDKRVKMLIIRCREMALTGFKEVEKREETKVIRCFEMALYQTR